MILSFTSYSKWFYYTFTLHNTVSHSKSDQSGYSFSNGNTNTANRNYNMLVSEETGKRNKVIVEMIPLIARHTHTHTDNWYNRIRHSGEVLGLQAANKEKF